MQFGFNPFHSDGIPKHVDTISMGGSVVAQW